MSDTEQKISIKNRAFTYNPQKLDRDDIPAINVDIAKENLLLFNKIAKANDFRFVLFWGTLLGAIRENGFIKHDFDIDVVSCDEDKLLDIIPLFQKEGFLFIRYYTSKARTMYSFSKDGVFIDVYIAKNAGADKYYLCGAKIPASFIDRTEFFSFIGENFLIPQEYEKILVMIYGKDWRIPQDKNGHFPLYMRRDFDQIFIQLFPKSLRNFIKKLLGLNK